MTVMQTSPLKKINAFAKLQSVFIYLTLISIDQQPRYFKFPFYLSNNAETFVYGFVCMCVFL